MKDKEIKYNCLFNDLSGEKTQKLSMHISSNISYDKKAISINYSNIDYMKLKTEIANRLGSHNRKKFVFVDPYNYKEISIFDIEKVMQDDHTEVLLFLPTQFMYRFEKKGTPEVLYKFLSELFPEHEIGKSKNGIEFIEKLRDGFGRRLNNKYVDSFIITRDQNQYFALFFFTSHIYGFEKFLEAKWDIDEEQGRGWSPNLNKNDLFSSITPQPNTNKFQEKLHQFIFSKKTNIELYNFTIENRHLIKHINQLLELLQEENRLEVTMIDGSKARRKSFYINWKEVKTKTPKCYICLK